MRKRSIGQHDMPACKAAFIDCRMPGSTAKENYSLIGLGVIQSEDQVVNITEPHRFGLGVAGIGVRYVALLRQLPPESRRRAA